MSRHPRLSLLVAALFAPASACTFLDLDGLQSGTDQGLGEGAGGAGGDASGGGGTGGTSECDGPSDCPAPEDECVTPVCLSETCGTAAHPMGVVAPFTQTDGDCRVNVCDGMGGIQELHDDEDPDEDGSDCTLDECDSGVPIRSSMEIGASCATGGGVVCDAAGSCVECNAASDCPGVDNECQQRTCKGHACGMFYVDDGTPVIGQTAGDCKLEVCDGAGATMPVADPSDLPDDNDACTVDTCNGTTPTFTQKSEGDSCGQSLLCNASGQCVGCVVPADCDGNEDFCKTKTCSAGVCGYAFTGDNTPLPVGQQVSGDCHELQCNGTGGIETVVANTDVPAEDGFDCTYGACSSGLPSQTPYPPGTACDEGGGQVCDPNGMCVECNGGGDCSGPLQTCTQWGCSSNQCVVVNTPSGVPAPNQTIGDCKVLLCNGSGGTTSANDDADVYVDGNECTGDACAMGTPQNPALPPGTACMQDDGAVCDGAGACVECTLDGHCRVDQYCNTATHACIAKRTQGTTCSTHNQCVSGACVDGVCCESTCKGLCKACSMNKTGQANGKCAFIPADTDPDNECIGIAEPMSYTPMLEEPIGGAGFCDGAGKCK